MPLKGCDVCLGMPQFIEMDATTREKEKMVTVTHRGKDHVLDVKLKKESIHVSTSTINKVKKNHLFVYMAFVQDLNLVDENVIVSQVDKQRSSFLKKSFDCY